MLKERRVNFLPEMEALDTRNGSIGQLGREVGACRDRGEGQNVVHAVKPAMARPRQPLNYLGSYAIRLFPG